MTTPYNEPSAHPLPSSPPSFTNSTIMTPKTVIILVVLFCGLHLVLAINAVIRFLLCTRRSDPGKQAASGKEVAASPPAKVVSALAGAEEECVICLAEFVEGDVVQFLPACNHGFHVQCIKQWLVSRRSCPTCRASFYEPASEKGIVEDA